MTTSEDAASGADPSRSPLRFAQRAATLIVALPMLLGPALWNGFPLLEYDTGGYIARWYEGYLVPSRSTTFGIFLKAGEAFGYWPTVAAHALATIWVLTLCLRVFGVATRARRQLAIIGALSIVTTLPWLTSVLLTDIFAGLGVLSLHLLVFRSADLRAVEKFGLFALIAFATATHSATFVVLLALVAAGVAANMLFRPLVPLDGFVRGAAAILAGAAMLMTTNFALSGEFRWTPGGFGIAFGRMLQDGIVARYLSEHCPDTRLKLCPYRNELPMNADQFLWSGGVFNRLGRFTGLEDEMRVIVLRSLAEYPGLQLAKAMEATAKQLVLNGTGEGVHNALWHTYGIIERFVPSEVPAMRAARQQRGDLNFDLLNRLHTPVALLSIVLLFGMVARAVRRRELDDLTLLATTAMLALLVNAFCCGALSGPHDRYGARLAWIATFVIAVTLARAWAGSEQSVAPRELACLPEPQADTGQSR